MRGHAIATRRLRLTRGRAATALAGGAAVAVLALGVTACGGSAHAGRTTAARPAATRSTTTPVVGTSPAAESNPITRAVAASLAAPGERIHTTLSLGPAAERITAVASGAFMNTPLAGEIHATLEIPASDGNLGELGSFLSGVPLEFVVSRTTADLKVPSVLAGLLAGTTGGKPWVSVDLAQLADSPKTAALATLLGGQAGLTNPVAALRVLEAVGSGDIHEVGSTTVGGVATTQYRAVVRTANLERLLRSSGGVAAQALTQLRAAGVSSVPYAVDVDHSGRIRRVSFSLVAQLGGVATPLTLDSEFLSYGQQTLAPAPAPAQTADITQLLASLA